MSPREPSLRLVGTAHTLLCLRSASPSPFFDDLVQIVTYLGVELNSAVECRSHNSEWRILQLFSPAQCPPNVVTALSVMRLLGMMSAGHVVVPLGLLHMRRLQRWFIRLHVDPILVRTDNKATVAYISRQGGDRAVYIPGMLNMGADILSIGIPRHGDWSLHPELRLISGRPLEMP
ncbi:unnamed protein product [Pleuronectes platessa]|uniref:Uncharacterized protein n=1 Tax=Pleuronectes platessa TaxID=8262 RepID=A0A9N7YMW8_PLEPL|nr:unnamed protein product [Pleuronectes platessa]